VSGSTLDEDGALSGFGACSSEQWDRAVSLALRTPPRSAADTELLLTLHRPAMPPPPFGAVGDWLSFFESQRDHDGRVQRHVGWVREEAAGFWLNRKYRGARLEALREAFLMRPHDETVLAQVPQRVYDRAHRQHPAPPAPQPPVLPVGLSETSLQRMIDASRDVWGLAHQARGVVAALWAPAGPTAGPTGPSPQRCFMVRFELQLTSDGS